MINPPCSNPLARLISRDASYSKSEVGFVVLADEDPFHLVREARAYYATLEASHAALFEALMAVADECRLYPESPRSFSGDSYLPGHIAEKIRAALAINPPQPGSRK